MLNVQNAFVDNALCALYLDLFKSFMHMIIRRRYIVMMCIQMCVLNITPHVIIRMLFCLCCTYTHSYTHTLQLLQTLYSNELNRYVRTLCFSRIIITILIIS